MPDGAEEFDRFVSAELRDEDTGELSLRPRRLQEMIGQSRVKENLAIAVAAALQRGEPLDHVLLHGPPGLGKTTLAGVLANEMSATIRVVAGPTIEKPGDLAAILTNLEPASILFIDEIHRLNRAVAEILYPAMEDLKLDVVIGRGPSARTLTITVPPFTLVGATTRAGLIPAPLRDRFGIQHAMEFYTTAELDMIVRRSADILQVEADPDGSMEVARRSRGTPRIANRLLKRVRDYAQVRADGSVTREATDAALGMLQVDSQGLDEFDRRFLTAIAVKFDGGPVGVDTLAAMFGVERDTIEDVYEPYLLQLGYLNRTRSGRTITRAGCAHVGAPFKGTSGDVAGGAPSLF